MALPLRSEVHADALGSQPYRQPSSGAPSGPGPDPALGLGPGPASSLQGLYACTPLDAVFTVVVLRPATRTVERAQPQAPLPVFGIIAAKPTPNRALVVQFGVVGQLYGLNPGARYFLGPGGSLVSPPLRREDLPYVHPVGFAVTQTDLFVMPQFPVLKRGEDEAPSA